MPIWSHTVWLGSHTVWPWSHTVRLQGHTVRLCGTDSFPGILTSKPHFLASRTRNSADLKPHCGALRTRNNADVKPHCGFEATQCGFKATLCGFAVWNQLLACYPRLTTIYFNFKNHTAQLPEPETVPLRSGTGRLWSHTVLIQSHTLWLRGVDLTTGMSPTRLTTIYLNFKTTVCCFANPKQFHCVLHCAKNTLRGAYAKNVYVCVYGGEGGVCLNIFIHILINVLKINISWLNMRSVGETTVMGVLFCCTSNMYCLQDIVIQKYFCHFVCEINVLLSILPI